MGIEEQAGAIAVRTTDIHLPRADRCHAREPRLGCRGVLSAASLASAGAASTSFMSAIGDGTPLREMLLDEVPQRPL
jgi:hypothetical protein